VLIHEARNAYLVTDVDRVIADPWPYLERLDRIGAAACGRRLAVIAVARELLARIHAIKDSP